MNSIEPNTVDDWYRLYGLSWKGAIEDDSFAHPAKFARGLIGRIIEHTLEEDWLRPGDTVLDPFGGVSLGALAAMGRRLNWVGMELEERFVLMGNRNIQRWENLYRAGGYDQAGSAYLYHGDSRYLSLLLGRRANGCVSSPPYARYGVGHDPSPRLDTKEDKRRAEEGCARRPTYGVSGGQLSAMKEGDFEACVSSPPYASIRQDGGGRMNKAGEGGFGAYSTEAPDVWHTQRDQSNMGNLREPAGDFQACVSSPPYAASVNQSDGANDAEARLRRKSQSGVDISQAVNRGGPNSVLNQPQVYGNSPAQLGAERGETFWAASRQVIEQVYQVLTPGAHAIWVCKDFVRKGERVPFTHRWAELCVACGFEWLHEHRAWLTEGYGTQLGFFGDKPILKERKSFFRRLAENNGAPHIDWESVLCFRKGLT